VNRPSKLEKAEEDGDLHIELRDADNPHGVRVVVEVPLDRQRVMRQRHNMDQRGLN
jgi:hypothetical protein